jgi:hypothetical protein
LNAVAPIQLKCGIEGCGMSWSVANPKEMKSSMADHRQKFHHEAQSKPKGPKPLRSTPRSSDAE